ncbi:unnamed protein product [Chrysodeixis includens]|uniref:Uncharacterized protein n=1 Tax=Chrysodeixis includens TaxID=689277 RepID=A0A9N8L217_CHRIL|nr:unnamed protein product [Chrysodeixis includens]
MLSSCSNWRTLVLMAPSTVMSSLPSAPLTASTLRSARWLSIRWLRARTASHGRSSRSYGRSTSPPRIPTPRATSYSAELASKRTHTHNHPNKWKYEDSLTNRLTFH